MRQAKRNITNGKVSKWIRFAYLCKLLTNYEDAVIKRLIRNRR